MLKNLPSMAFQITGNLKLKTKTLPAAILDVEFSDWLQEKP